MARDNYSYNKYQKELARKKKAEEKKQRKLERKAMQAAPHLAISDSHVDGTANHPIGLGGVKRAPAGGESGQVSDDQVALE